MGEIPFVKAHDITHGQAETLSPLITRVTADNPGPFTYAGTGVFIIGTDTVAVIDPGPITPAHAKAMDAALMGKTVSHILLTHHHADHSPMAVPLAVQHNCPIYGRAPRPAKSDEVVVKLEEGEDESFAPHSSIEDGDVFSGPDWMLHAMHTPGHTPACLTYVIGDAAFVGDTLFMPDFGTARCDFPGGSAHDLYQSIQRILSLPDETRIFVGHDYKAPGRDEFAWETTVGEQKALNIHIGEGRPLEDFVSMRTARDAKLGMPRLILPSIQTNMRAGQMPEPEDNGTRYFKVPINTI